METNRKLLIGIVAGIAVALIFILCRGKFHRNDHIAADQEAPAVSVEKRPSNPSSTQTIVDARFSSAATNIAEGYNQGAINKAEAMQAAQAEENKHSLDIYGKIVDKYGEPVAGAKVDGSVLLNGNVVESSGEMHVTQTDSQGRFQFIGIHGIHIGIWPKKEGYTYDVKHGAQRPDNYIPDPNNLVIFRMWKIQGAAPLVSQTVESKIPSDGNSISFDLENGTESSNGDFRVTFLRSPREIYRGRDKFDWALKIEMLNGGLLKQDDTYPYSAPDNGYQPFFEKSMSSNDVPWRSTLDEKFYFKNSSGKYGRMTFSLSGALMPPRVQIDTAINPSGSKNLEPVLDQ